jgi:hypothetical protein
MFDLSKELSHENLDGKTVTIDELLKVLVSIGVRCFKDIPVDIRAKDLFLYGKSRGLFSEQEDGRIQIALQRDIKAA